MIREMNDFHPLVMEWLRLNGYKYKHEARMKEYGKADLVATKRGELDLVIECKVECGRSFGRDAAQVLDYARQHKKHTGDCVACIAIPEHIQTELAQEIAAYYGIRLLLIPCREQYEKNQVYTKMMGIIGDRLRGVGAFALRVAVARERKKLHLISEQEGNEMNARAEKVIAETYRDFLVATMDNFGMDYDSAISHIVTFYQQATGGDKKAIAKFLTDGNDDNTA